MCYSIQKNKTFREEKNLFSSIMKIHAESRWQHLLEKWLRMEIVRFVEFYLLLRRLDFYRTKKVLRSSFRLSWEGEVRWSLFGVKAFGVFDRLASFKLLIQIGHQEYAQSNTITKRIWPLRVSTSQVLI